MNQHKAILEHLQAGKTITSIEAIQLYGATRLSAIIFNLRKRGYNIVTTLITVPTRYETTTRVAQYALIEG